MVSYHCAWLVWSGVFLLAFLTVYLLSPKQRSTMLQASRAAVLKSGWPS